MLKRSFETTASVSRDGGPDRRPYPVVERVLRPRQAAVVAAVRLRRHDPASERPVEGGGGRTDGRGLAVARGWPGRSVVQRQRGVREPPDIDLVSCSTNV